MTTTTLTLTDFLLARIAEDEAVARVATSGPWRYAAGDEGEDGAVLCAVQRGPDLSSNFVAMTSYDGLSSTSCNSDGDGEHIARHDPARVLAECEAKRRIVEECANMPSNVAPPAAAVYHHVCRRLAAVYADHPDYRDEWRP